MLYDLTRFVDPATINVDELVEQANEGDTSALYLGSYIAQCGLNLLDNVSEKTALEWAKAGAEKDDPLCMAVYGIMRASRFGALPDTRVSALYIGRSREWIKQAANEDHVYALSVLGVQVINGVGYKPDPKLAATYFERAMTLGDIASMHTLGTLYEGGTGVKRNLIAAESHYRVAADHGHATAQLNLGLMLINQKQTDEALEWLTRSAKQGRVSAQYNLGKIFAGKLGSGVELDPEKAFTWYNMAAEQGHAAAIVETAHAYRDGRGVEQSIATGFAMLNSLVNRDGRTLETTPLAPELNRAVSRDMMLMRSGSSVERVAGAGELVITFKDGSVAALKSAGTPPSRPSGHPSSQKNKHSHHRKG